MRDWWDFFIIFSMALYHFQELFWPFVVKDVFFNLIPLWFNHDISFSYAFTFLLMSYFSWTPLGLSFYLSCKTPWWICFLDLTPQGICLFGQYTWFVSCFLCWCLFLLPSFVLCWPSVLPVPVLIFCWSYALFLLPHLTFLCFFCLREILLDCWCC